MCYEIVLAISFVASGVSSDKKRTEIAMWKAMGENVRA